MSRSHRHHRSGHHAGLHRDKLVRRWQILAMLGVGIPVIVLLICLSLAR
jgi:hypothetical protein